MPGVSCFNNGVFAKNFTGSLFAHPHPSKFHQSPSGFKKIYAKMFSRLIIISVFVGFSPTVIPTCCVLHTTIIAYEPTSETCAQKMGVIGCLV